MPRFILALAPPLGTCAIFCLCLSAPGCAQFDPVTGNTLVGSGLGAATGAIIGHQSGHRDAGALIGAATGAIGGALVGNAQQARHERDAALAYAQNVQQAQTLNPPVGNHDVVYMAQNGLGEDVIINAIQTRGGQFDTSPQALIQLKAAGVSESVIQTMQTNSRMALPTPGYLPPPPPPSPRVLVVEPRPTVIFGDPYCDPHFDHWHHRRHWHRRHHDHHDRHRSGIHIHGHF